MKFCRDFVTSKVTNASLFRTNDCYLRHVFPHSRPSPRPPSGNYWAPTGVIVITLYV